MSLPASGPMSLNAILAEFDAPARTPLRAMLAGGEYVPADAFVGVPESLPLQMQDFYGLEADPNPVTLNNITLRNNEIKVVASSRRGLPVAGYGGGVVPADAKYVLDMDVLIGPNASDGHNRGFYQLGSTEFTNATQVMAVFAGITFRDPLKYDDATLLANCSKNRVNFSRCDQAYGYAEFGSYANPVYDTSGSNYGSNVRPSKSLAAKLRFQRGITTAGSSIGTLVTLRTRAGATWKTSAMYVGQVNSPGYVIVGCLGPDIKISNVKLATGTTTPPW